MSEPQPQPKKSIWDLVGTRVGVISAAVGLVIAVVGLPRTIAAALDRSDSEVTELEIQQKRATLAAAAPRLDVRYQILTLELYERARFTAEPEAAKPPASATVYSLPIVQNEIPDQLYQDHGRGCRFDKSTTFSIVLLVITNRGGRDATDVAVDLDRLRFAAPVRVREGAAGGDDYVAKLRGATTTSARKTLRLPQTLGPGGGIRVPLFVIDAPLQRFDRWCALPPTAYLPRSLSYGDPALRSKASMTVRRMVDPVLLSNGAIDRG